MSKLDILIKDYCPKGVETKRLGDVITFINGRAYKQTELLNDGKYKVLRVGNFFTSEKWYYSDLELEDNKYCYNGDLLYAWAASLGPQIWNDEKTIFHYHIWKLVFDENIINKRYLYHFLLKDVNEIYNSLTHSTMPHISMANMKERRFPLPPLPVQQEIVRILDSFTTLTAELQAELQAEVQTRKKQLAHYRSMLIERASEKKVKLSEIVDIFLGLTATPNYTDYGVKFISAQNTSSDILDLSNVKYISEEEYEKASNNAKPRKGDLLFTRVGSNLGHPVIVDTDEKLCIFVSLGFLRVRDENTVFIDYLKHWMNTELFWEQVRKKVHGAAKVNLNTGWLKDFELQLPSLEKQKKIVSRLNKLEVLCADINNAIPAEIQRREQQYRYYCDILLTFKELSA